MIERALLAGVAKCVCWTLVVIERVSVAVPGCKVCMLAVQRVLFAVAAKVAN